MDASALIAQIGSATAPHALSLSKKMGQAVYDKFVLTCTNVFSHHVATTVSRCSKVKSLLHRDQALKLDKQYVSLNFKTEDRLLSDKDILERVSVGTNSFLVSGLAGCGKSMFMKWLALRSVERIGSSQRIPLFIELRDVPHDRLGLPIDQLIFEHSASEESKAHFGLLQTALIGGMFTILMDGLDEVPVKHRDAILIEISDFQRRFPKANIICSSRPNRAIESSAGLTVAHVLPMEVEQIVQVIERAAFDRAKKTAFIKELESGLYEKHESFLSNPLLAIIMLITFDMSTDVPSRLSLFYSQVFETLFYKHDSSKGVYTREHYASLEIDKFEAVFRAFCFHTYAANKHSFEMTDLVDAVRRSLKFCRLEEIKPGYFIKDCMQSLSIMQEDGPYISFVHRSFQEYFAARFLVFYVGEHYYELVNGIAARDLSDSTLQMLSEMNIDRVLQGWVAPKIHNMIHRLDIVDKTDPHDVVTILNHYTNSFTVVEASGEIHAWTWSTFEGPSEINALNKALSIGGINITISPFLGSKIREWPPDLAEVDKDDPFWKQVMKSEVTIDDDLECIEIPIDITSAEWILQTNVIEMLEKYRANLQQALDALNERFTASNAFGAQIAGLLL